MSESTERQQVHYDPQSPNPYSYQSGGQKAPSAKRCIKTGCDGKAHGEAEAGGQKAPSAKRCIKTTLRSWTSPSFSLVTKHRAPKGCIKTEAGRWSCRKLWRQKAPSAKRCIKTTPLPRGSFPLAFVRKHRAPTGALRHCRICRPVINLDESESTERQKVH